MPHSVVHILISVYDSPPIKYLPGKMFKIKNIITNFYLTSVYHLTYKCRHLFVVGSDFSCADRQGVAVVEIGEFAAVTVVILARVNHGTSGSKSSGGTNARHEPVMYMS